MAAGANWFNYTERAARRRRRRRGGFRSVELNAAGWTAVLGPGALLGVLLAGVAGWSFALLALAGGTATWLCALVLDTIAWRRTPLTISADLALDEAEAVVDQLRRRGIEVDLGPLEEDDASSAWAIRSTVRHRRSINEAIIAARHRPGT